MAQLPAAAPRASGDLVALAHDKSFKRSLWLYLGVLVAVPELCLAVFAIFAVPSAVLSALLWPFDPGNVDLMGVPIDSWWDALLARHRCRSLSVSVCWAGWLPAVARGHANAVISCWRPVPISWRPRDSASA